MKAGPALPAAPTLCSAWLRRLPKQQQETCYSPTHLGARQLVLHLQLGSLQCRLWVLGGRIPRRACQTCSDHPTRGLLQEEPALGSLAEVAMAGLQIE